MARGRMIHARRATDGSLYHAEERAATYPDDVPVVRAWGPGEVVMACGEECEKKHAEGEPRCILPHVALIAARAAAGAREARVQATLRKMADEQIAAEDAKLQHTTVAAL